MNKAVVFSIVLASVLQIALASEISFYDKGFLNDPVMQFDNDPLRTALEQHTLKVREGSIGGYDSAGGSCGCN